MRSMTCHALAALALTTSLSGAAFAESHAALTGDLKTPDRH